MIRKAEEMFKEIKEQMRGGKGSVELTHAFTREDMHGKARLCAKIMLNPGCSIGLHNHENEDEIFYIMKGKALVDDNGEKQEVHPGDAIITGGGDYHSIENAGDEPTELLAVIILY